MTTTKIDEISSSLFEPIGNKLNTVRSNRSLVAANQQLRIQLAFSKAEIIRLQNEIVELQQQIAALELTSDGERIEMIVRKRLKQSVEHLKSIANRTVQYMKKTKVDFDHAASRLDHVVLSSNSDETDICSDECSEDGIVTSACETGNEIIDRHVQRPLALEVVEEDICGEMDENDDNITSGRPIVPLSSGSFNQLRGNCKSSNIRRKTFFIKNNPHEFENEMGTSFVESSFLETNQTVSSQNHEDPSALDVMTELGTPTTVSVSNTPTKFLESEKPTTCSISGSCTLETSTPCKNIENSGVRKLEVVTHTKKKRRLSTNQVWKRCKKSVENNVKATKEINRLLTTPTPTSGILGIANLNESFRYKRAAAAKISSFKEPNLLTKMRNPNIH